MNDKTNKVVVRAKGDVSLSTVYCCTILVLFICSFMTEFRVWGFSTWGYLPLLGKLLLVATGLCVIPIARRLRDFQSNPKLSGNATYFLIAGGITLALGICYWYFRDTTHFLGNGLTHLASMSAANPIIKWHEPGESYIHLWIAQAFGGNTEANVLRSYQWVSLLSGLGLAILTFWTSQQLYEKLFDRLCFALGVLTAGHSLLFFGYVENRSLLALGIGSVLLIGALASEGKVRRWTLIIPMLATIGMHIFGIFLVPGVLYLLIGESNPAPRAKGMSRAAKISITACLAVLIGTAFCIWWSHSLFLQIALLYPIATRFTIQGYTLFSLSHLADFANLIFLLSPWVFLVATAFITDTSRTMRHSRRFRFLAITTLCAIVGAFTFEPKLGMPRDWDLFSFPALPLASLGFWYMLDRANRFPKARLVAVFAIALSVLSLGSRAFTLANAECSVSQISDYYRLDPLKSKNALIYLKSYYLNAGDSISADSLGAIYASFPDEILYQQIERYFAQGQFDNAMIASAQASMINPMSWRAFQYMGTAYYRSGRNTEAEQALDTALGLNPYNAISLLVLGAIRWRENRLDEAQEIELKAMRYGPQFAAPAYYLAGIFGQRGRPEDEMKYLLVATSKGDAIPEMFTELAEAYLRKGMVREAALAVNKALRAGMPDSDLQAMMAKHVELRQFFNQ